MEGYKPQDFSFFHRSEKLVQHITDMRKFSSLEQSAIRAMVRGVQASHSYLPINAYQDIFFQKKIGFKDTACELIFYRPIKQINHDEILAIESEIIEISLLLGYLEENRLIYYLHEETRPEDKIHNIGIRDNESGVYEIRKSLDVGAYNHLVHAINYRIFVSQDLKDMVANNFETIEEKSLKESRKQTKWSVIATVIALVALLVSLVKDCSGGNSDTEIYNDNDSTSVVVPVGIGAMLNYMHNSIEGKLDATMNNTADIKAKLCDTISVNVNNCKCKEKPKPKGKEPKKEPTAKSPGKKNPCVKWQKVNTCEDTIVKKSSLTGAPYN